MVSDVVESWDHVVYLYIYISLSLSLPLSVRYYSRMVLGFNLLAVFAGTTSKDGPFSQQK